MNAEPSNLPVRTATQSVDIFADSATFEHNQRIAKVFAASNLVPKHFQGNVGDCLIALQIARRLNEEPLTVYQNLYIVSGRPGWSTAYMISRANRSGVFSSRITWDETGEGADLALTAKATIADTGEEVRVTADMKMAKAEGWTKNAKYTSMPTHMLRWRSAAMLIRLYAPEVMLGMPTVDEIEPAPAPMRDVTPARSAAQSLDTFAAEAEAAAALRTTDTAAADALDGLAAESETVDEVAEEKVAAPAASPDPGEVKTPTNEAEYVAHAQAWISVLGGKQDGMAMWKAEAKLRNKCNISPEVRDDLEAMLTDRIADLVIAAKAG